MNYQQTSNIGQLFDFDPDTNVVNRPLPFLAPEAVVLRNNTFQVVQIPYSGTALSDALLSAK